MTWRPSTLLSPLGVGEPSVQPYQLDRVHKMLVAIQDAALPKPSLAKLGINHVSVMIVQHDSPGLWWCLELLDLAPLWQSVRRDLYPTDLVMDFGEWNDVTESWRGPYVQSELHKLCALGREWLAAGPAGLQSTSVPLAWRKVFPSLYKGGNR